MFEFDFLQTLLVFLICLARLLTITFFFLLKCGDLLIKEVSLASHTLDLVFLVNELSLQHPKQILVFATIFLDILW
jgi:hypothetical protein